MSKKPIFEDLVDMTAMVDIVFFVLIFFMVTSMAGVYASISMPTPDPEKQAKTGVRSRTEIESDKDSVIVRIDRDDAIFVNDSEVAGGSELDLRARLKDARESGSKPTKMMVMASGEAKHGTLVMVLDAGQAAEFTEVQMAIDDDS
jgi:biopolymer transport protein ExbD